MSLKYLIRIFLLKMIFFFFFLSLNKFIFVLFFSKASFLTKIASEWKSSLFYIYFVQYKETDLNQYRKVWQVAKFSPSSPLSMVSTKYGLLIICTRFQIKFCDKGRITY